MGAAVASPEGLSGGKVEQSTSMIIFMTVSEKK